MEQMQKERESSNSTNCSPEPGKGRFVLLRQRLTMQVQRILDEDKVETGKETRKRKYTNLQEVHCMKDIKSERGFEEEYELKEKLGEGCHSSVYRCYSKKENKDYAVKVMKEKDMEIFDSIRENYRILRRLEHENIIRVKNLFINQKTMTCHLVLQYCEWQNLQKFMLSNQLLKSEEISEIIAQLLKTLSYMHELGVCHRDIRPENILYNKKSRKIKVIDFDVARIRKYSNAKLEMLTQTGVLSYRAPETFGSPYTEKIDIWAAGVIAYQLMTGHLPFEGEYEQDCIKKIQCEDPCYEGLSLWEQELLQKLLCKKPESRSKAAEALSSPYLFMHAKFISRKPKENICRSPSLGKGFHPNKKQKEFTNKFYDDELTNLFLGENEGDIGVIRCEEKNY